MDVVPLLPARLLRSDGSGGRLGVARRRSSGAVSTCAGICCHSLSYHQHM